MKDSPLTPTADCVFRDGHRWPIGLGRLFLWTELDTAHCYHASEAVHDWIGMRLFFDEWRLVAPQATATDSTRASRAEVSR